MKRTIPLLITATGGFVLIVAFFIPATQGWGEVTAIWFDILAAIAFILGGANLLRIHLKKVSDRTAGWGYSAVTVLSFLGVLAAGVLKLGAPPATRQEYYGETFSPLALDAFPESQIAQLPGTIPARKAEPSLPASVRRQLSESNGQLRFRGWMLPHQARDLVEYKSLLEWESLVEQLAEAAQPPEPLSGSLSYYADHEVLSFRGFMSDEQKAAALQMSDEPQWTEAVERLYEQSRRTTTVPLDGLPSLITIPADLRETVSFDSAAQQLSVAGPMSVAMRDALARRFPVAKPLDDDRRHALRRELESRGDPLSDAQQNAMNRLLDATWSVEQLQTTLNEAGRPQQVPKSAREMLAEKKAGVAQIAPLKTVGHAVTLSAAQLDVIAEFASDRNATVDALDEQLTEAGEWTGAQQQALRSFFARAETNGERNKALYFALLRAGPLADGQREYLLADYPNEFRWRQKVGQLFVAAHVPKFRWSGGYRSTGTPFWWFYEYAFKPLTATVFAMLAFYVASAAFRAFRAKNLHAILLLCTAFIILLGRTFAGVLLTSWIPDSLAGLRIENMTVYVMSIFNTAGNRAIMIGIALGIASTSLKVLLGVDRSYLGSSEE